MRKWIEERYRYKPLFSDSEIEKYYVLYLDAEPTVERVNTGDVEEIIRYYVERLGRVKDWLDFPYYDWWKDAKRLLEQGFEAAWKVTLPHIKPAELYIVKSKDKYYTIKEKKKVPAYEKEVKMFGEAVYVEVDNAPFYASLDVAYWAEWQGKQYYAMDVINIYGPNDTNRMGYRFWVSVDKTYIKQPREDYIEEYVVAYRPIYFDSLP